jgi:hypothetical protein
MGAWMQISENSIKHLQWWKRDIEIKVQNNSKVWDELYPLYSQICFWLNKKLKNDFIQRNPNIPKLFE